jgi:hypothetical protein
LIVRRFYHSVHTRQLILGSVSSWCGATCRPPIMGRTWSTSASSDLYSWNIKPQLMPLWTRWWKPPVHYLLSYKVLKCLNSIFYCFIVLWSILYQSLKQYSSIIQSMIFFQEFLALELQLITTSTRFVRYNFIAYCSLHYSSLQWASL